MNLYNTENKNNLKSVLKYFVLLTTTFLFSEIILTKFKIYYEFPWIDNPMHVLGGYLVGGFVLYSLFVLFKNKFSIKNRSDFFIFLFCVLCVGVDWEILEYVRDLYNFGSWNGTWPDTIKDIINDIIGALIFIYFYMLKLDNKDKINK